MKDKKQDLVSMTSVISVAFFIFSLVGLSSVDFGGSLRYAYYRNGEYRGFTFRGHYTDPIVELILQEYSVKKDGWFRRWTSTQTIATGFDGGWGTFRIHKDILGRQPADIAYFFHQMWLMIVPSLWVLLSVRRTLWVLYRRKRLGPRGFPVLPPTRDDQPTLEHKLNPPSEVDPRRDERQITVSLGSLVTFVVVLCFLYFVDIKGVLKYTYFPHAEYRSVILKGEDRTLLLCLESHNYKTDVEFRSYADATPIDTGWGVGWDFMDAYVMTPTRADHMVNISQMWLLTLPGLWLLLSLLLSRRRCHHQKQENIPRFPIAAALTKSD